MHQQNILILMQLVCKNLLTNINHFNDLFLSLKWLNYLATDGLCIWYIN